MLCVIAGCGRKEPTRDPAEARLQALYNQQNAVFGGRYGQVEASADIARAIPKIYRYGLPQEHDQTWSRILKQRFGITVESVAGCEASPELTNFVDAYNARILEHIAQKFGPTAYADSREEAVREFQKQQTNPAK